jgi:hypothetical protein
MISEPLTYERVFRANRAAAALFKWCVKIWESMATNTTEISNDIEYETGVTSTSAIMTEELVSPVEEQPEDDVMDIETHDHHPTKVEENDSNVEENDSNAELIDSFKKRVIMREWRNMCIRMRPDRHFEDVVCFSVRTTKLEKDQRPVVWKVLRAMRTRPSLQLHLLGCEDVLEGQVISDARMFTISRFFTARGIPTSNGGKGRTATISNPSGIVCKLELSSERHLRDFYRSRDSALQEGNRTECDFDVFAMMLAVIACESLGEEVPEIDALALASRKHLYSMQVLSSVILLRDFPTCCLQYGWRIISR